MSLVVLCFKWSNQRSNPGLPEFEWFDHVDQFAKLTPLDTLNLIIMVMANLAKVSMPSCEVFRAAWKCTNYFTNCLELSKDVKIGCQKDVQGVSPRGFKGRGALW